MSSPSTSQVGSVAESIDSASPISQAGEPWLPEPEELPTTPWYEEKASTLRLSDIPIIKDKGGMMGKFEVVIPHPDERAHRPPPGFHILHEPDRDGPPVPDPEVHCCLLPSHFTEPEPASAELL
ncbi:hypothetical protein F511_10578 [Dorcoceras hygrometricum]|uniref:Uncharacterized protein n=1 Tax=Dorcoceras hygrometricum TaxID=472368 RepID=A0A2Z7CIF3_9LAMI|nr:hypothetical protein F511_10578 [Dorcoceras hygrometricum]